MELKEIKIERRFVPDWNGNKKQSPDKQVVIHFSRIPGTSEKATYKSFKFGTTGDVQLSYNDNLLVSAFVERIDNLKIGEQIKDGKKLATTSHPKLEELFTEIRDYLFPDDEDISQGESEA